MGGSAQLGERVAERGVATENDATLISLENVAVAMPFGNCEQRPSLEVGVGIPPSRHSPPPNRDRVATSI